MTVGLAIPSIPPRGPLLQRAVASVLAQTLPPDALSIAFDREGRGASDTRNRAWRALDTDWVAFLDDDDELGPDHLAKLLACAEANDADLVFPWFDVIGGTDPFPHRFGQAWDPAHPHQTTITCLWRRAALVKVDGFPEHSRTKFDDGHWKGEDAMAVLALNDLGGRIVHLPERTWHWHHHNECGGNTMGLPERWR